MRYSLQAFCSLRSNLITIVAAGFAVTSSAAVWNDQVGLQLESLGSKISWDMPGTLNEVQYLQKMQW
jgi:hypothetical protein